MARHANQAPALGLAMPQKVLTQLVIGLAAGLRNGLVPLGLRRPKESISLSLEVLAQHVAHPVRVRSKPVVMVAPFAQLDGIEDARVIEDTNRRLVVG